MARLDEIAKIIRSKNAGPFFYTLDILFADEASYDRVRRSGEIEREKMALLYREDPENVFVYHHPAARAMKVTIVRKVPAGSIFDADIYGAQRHMLLYPLEID
jgi:hypothetical protein